jgi:hypothetical protein
MSCMKPSRSGGLRLPAVACLKRISQYLPEEKRNNKESVALTGLRSGSRNAGPHEYEGGALSPQLRRPICGALLPLLLTGLYGLVLSHSGNYLLFHK